MPKNNSNKQSELSLKKLIFPLIIGLTVFFISIIVSAFIVSKSAYPKNNPTVLMLVSSVISGFIAGFLSTLKIRNNGLVTGLITGSILALFEFLIIVFISVFSIRQSAFLILPCCILPASLAGILGVNINFK